MRRTRRLAVCRCLMAVLAAALLLFLPAPSASAGDMTPIPGAPAGGGLSGLLDGQVFAGEYGVVGKGTLGTDRWTFRDGMFVSENCLDCGFPANPYWIRSEDRETAFMTEARCPRTDATIVWRGTVRDGVVEGEFTWTRERWYWTIEKTFWFRGTLQPASLAMSPQPEDRTAR